MGIVGWIILGGLAGWLASILTGRNAKMGLVANIVVGVVGAFIGGTIMNLIGGAGVTGFNLWSLFVALLGAVVLLVFINLISGKR